MYFSFNYGQDPMEKPISEMSIQEFFDMPKRDSEVVNKDYTSMSLSTSFGFDFLNQEPDFSNMKFGIRPEGEEVTNGYLISGATLEKLEEFLETSKKIMDHPKMQGRIDDLLKEISDIKNV